MNLFNATPFAAAYSLGIQKSGRNCLVIVVKATYNLPKKSGEEPQLADEQIEPFETDTYTGEPGLSAPIYENDYATYKPLCDVILHASAYSLQPIEEKQVGFKVGKTEKVIKVIGPRYLMKSTSGNHPSKPEPFTQQKISYDTAYGGSDKDKKPDENGEDTFKSFIQNPIGIGFYPNCNADERAGKPMPQSEEIGDPITSLKSKKYSPQSFGPVARNWYPRHLLGGTYDKNWNDNVRPFLPEDFDEHYYQCAPKDQQVPHLKGGEEVVLVGIVPQGKIRFNLPKASIPMQAILNNGERHNLNPVIDTLIIEPDEERFTMVWRSRIALKKNVHEVDTLIAGKPTPAWERARMMDKLFLPLDQLNAFKKRMEKQIAEEERIRKLNENDGDSSNGLAKEIKP